MAKRIQQVRYYGDNNSKNQPTSLTGNELRTGSIFSNYIPIRQLGIQTLPGVKFYVNDSPSPIIVGATGIYELDIDGLADITGLSFDTTAINLIKASPSTNYLLVDLIYEDGEG